MALFDKEPEDLTQAVHVAVGAASACWENLAGAGVFDSDRARDVAQGLIGYIEANYLPKGEYTTEVGGQVFTQAQWEAVQVYARGTTTAATSVDNAIDNPDVLDQLPLDERIRNGL